MTSASNAIEASAIWPSASRDAARRSESRGDGTGDADADGARGVRTMPAVAAGRGGVDPGLGKSSGVLLASSGLAIATPA